MAKYHSTLSRREFMKILGLGGAGLGATALGAAVIPPGLNQIRDLDEVMALPQAALKRPSWVKEVDKPTIEIDWTIMKRFDYHYVMWAAGLKNALGPQQYDEVFRAREINLRKWIREKRPGCTLPDVALNNANNWGANSFIGPQSSPTPEDLDVPRWEGTPEENSRLLRSFLRLHGADLVTFCEIDTDTTEKTIYAYDTGLGEAQGALLPVHRGQPPCRRVRRPRNHDPDRAAAALPPTPPAAPPSPS